MRIHLPLWNAKLAFAEIPTHVGITPGFGDEIAGKYLPTPQYILFLVFFCVTLLQICLLKVVKRLASLMPKKGMLLRPGVSFPSGIISPIELSVTK